MNALCTRTHYSNRLMTLYERGKVYDIDENDPKNQRFFDIPEVKPKAAQKATPKE